VSAAVRYGTTSVALVGLLTLLLWPFLGSPARMGILVAATVAVPVQIAAFSILVRYRGRMPGFMAAWAGGMAMRAIVLVAVAVLVVRAGSATAVPTLLALAGYFFVLLLLEPVYFRAGPSQTL